MFSGEGKTTGKGNELREKTELYGKFLDEVSCWLFIFLNPGIKAKVLSFYDIKLRHCF